jgi:hypothetical protein
MQKNAPDFIGIGADHCGLNLITALVAAHPEVVSTIPAGNFFDAAVYTDASLAVYEAGLPRRGRGKKAHVIGEVSSGYLASETAAERIVTAYPTTKLFAIVRNPLERAIAVFEHAKAAGKTGPHLSCAHYLANHPTVQRGGFYGQHLHSFFEYYTSIQLHVIVYEDFARDPLKVLEELYSFLEIDPHFIPKSLAAYAPLPDEPKHPGRIYRTIRLLKNLYKKMRPTPFIPATPPPYVLSRYFSAKELEAFKAVYAADCLHLTNLLHRDMGVFWELKPEVVIAP